MIATLWLSPVGALAEDSATDGSRAVEWRTSDVVFEVRADACPRATDEYIRAVINQLQRSGRAALPSVVTKTLHGLIPLPGKTDPSMTASRIRAKFDEAQKRATGKNWNFDEAIALYEEGFRWAAENQAIVVVELDAPTWMTEALVGYATALARKNRLADAKAAYKTQIVSFPDLPVTKNRHGPSAASEYEAVRKELDAAPRGTLLVTVNRPDATIFVNYVGRGRGGSFQANVVAGTYEVLVQVGDKSLRYVVETDPATTKHAELRIDWDVDSRVVVGDASVCFEHVTNQRDLAVRLQRKLPGARLVLTSTSVSDGKRWVRVDRYEPGSTSPSPPCVTPEDDNVGRKLTDCVDGKRAPGVLASIPVQFHAPRERAEPPTQLRHWLGFGITMGAIGTAVYFASAHGTCSREDASLPGGCAETRNLWLETGISLGVGAVSLAYTVYAYNRWANTRSSRPAVDVSVTRGGGLMTLSGVF